LDHAKLSRPASADAQNGCCIKAAPTRWSVAIMEDVFPVLTTGLSLGLLLLLGLATLALSLDVLVVDSKSLVDLRLESSLILNTRTKLA
jgi:hypothetical protein